MDSPFSTFGLGLLCLAGLLALRFKLRTASRSLSYLGGPPSVHWTYGDKAPKPGQDPLAHYEAHLEEFGPSFKEIGLLGRPHLATSDPRAIVHILSKLDVYQKPEWRTWLLGVITGDTGLLATRGEQHKRIRRIVTPSFALVHVKELVPTFLDKAGQLVKLIDRRLTEDPHAEIDFREYSASCTFDIIGAAGFGTEFGCLDPAGKTSPFLQAMNGTTKSLTSDQSPLTALQMFIPAFRAIHSKLTRSLGHGRAVLEKVGRDIVRQKRAEILAKSASFEKVTQDDVGGGKDLLSVMLRASLADDIPANQKLSDDELIAQMVTLIVAGFETSATAVTLTLEALCDDPAIQDRLREELLSVDNDHPTYDELNDLPYLDAVVKESLRKFPPSAASFRFATEDDMLPLTVPVKNVQTGEMMSALPIKKGDQIAILTQNMHTSRAFFGGDAKEFNPDRWLAPLPQSTADLSPFWSKLGMFHIGSYACIGMRFALIEIKAILFTLLRSLEVRHLDPKPEMYHSLSIVLRPMVRGREAEGGVLPVRVRRVVSMDSD